MAGIIHDGFSTTIAMSLASSLAFKEKEVQPPGLSNEGGIDTTNMRNTAWRTKFPKSLKTATEVTATVLYDPVLYNTIISVLGVIQSFRVNFPDGSHVTFYGWLDQFAPQANKVDELPLAEIKVICSNQNSAGTEQPPVYSSS